MWGLQFCPALGVGRTLLEKPTVFLLGGDDFLGNQRVWSAF